VVRQLLSKGVLLPSEMQLCCQEEELSLSLLETVSPGQASIK